MNVLRYSLHTTIILLLLLLQTACKENAPAETPAVAPDPTVGRIEITPPAPAGPQAGETLTAWVDQLNIREQPDIKAKKAGNARKGEALTFTGERTDQPETIVLRGVAYHDHWFKIRTKDKLEGWVFAGAVKQEGEMKGNNVIDEMHFDFPAFGNFDLTKWSRVSTSASEEGDAETKTSLYQKADQLLEIVHTQVGEYGYGYDYKLMDAQKNILKERNFYFEATPEFLITETITDFTNSPPIRYTRSQPITKHFMQLNERPMMAAGMWTESELTGE